jgi:hypothetical protein
MELLRWVMGKWSWFVRNIAAKNGFEKGGLIPPRPHLESAHALTHLCTDIGVGFLFDDVSWHCQSPGVPVAREPMQ